MNRRRHDRQDRQQATDATRSQQTLMGDRETMLEAQRGAATNRAPSRTRHMRRLMSKQTARRSTRVVRQASMGQTLIIFALTFTVLIGFIGLAIDSIRVYDLYARMQRAAEAGALAGVIYMPDFYTSNLPSSPNDNAVCQAQKLVFKNSFGPTPCTDASNMPANYCPAVKSSVEVAVCKTTQPYQLQVFVTAPINVLFLGALGIGPLSITASAIAAYNPPLALAVDPTTPSTTGTLGNTCNGVSCGGRPWGLNINGPAELQEQGDPFVTCAGGNSDSQTLDPAPESNQTYTGWMSNMPLFAQSVDRSGGLNGVPTTCTAALSTPLASQAAYQNANPDVTMQPFQGAIYNDGTNNPPTHQGYSFYVNVATANSTLNVYNAPFNPGAPSSCNGRIFVGQSDSFFPCPSNKSPYSVYPGTGDASPNFDDPKMYFTVTYSIYSLPSGPLSPGNATYVGSFTALPYDINNGCVPASGFYKITAGTNCSSKCADTWCPVGKQVGDNSVPAAIKLPVGNYRLTVVSASYYNQGFNLGWGNHSYALSLCGPTETPPNCTQGGQLSAWSTMDTTFVFPGKGNGGPQHTSIPLGVFGSALAGRTIQVGFFDPGDLWGNNGGSGGNTGFAVVPDVSSTTDPCTQSIGQIAAAGYDTTPNGTTFTFPSWESSRVTTMDQIASASAFPALATSLNGDRAFNGLWGYEDITLPSSYAGTDWSVCSWSPHAVDIDIVGISAVALGQSPVHLIQ
jgi:hypothetical protein